VRSQPGFAFQLQAHRAKQRPVRAVRANVRRVLVAAAEKVKAAAAGNITIITVMTTAAVLA